MVYPFLQSLAYGFFDGSLLSDSQQFVGLGNFKELLASPDFWAMVRTTGVFVITSTLGAFVLALALAMALNAGLRRAAAWRTAFLIPWILPGVVVSFLWAWIFNTNYGLLNGIIGALGGPNDTNWLSSPTLAMVAVVVAKIWHSFPWMMVLLLAAMQAVPAELHDAAAVDGATGWRKQAYIVLPQIKPAIALTLLLETIWGLQHFEIPWVMTGGGPVGATTVLSVGLYKAAFTRYDLGQAGAIGLLWTILMAVVAIAYILYSVRLERQS
ncbi:sugar ABC transporter permease [Phycicoccus sp. MAQZ13P-2]|nr:sugar ABC transporter permease [Phycicoccus mangrovi]